MAVTVTAGLVKEASSAVQGLPAWAPGVVQGDPAGYAVKSSARRKGAIVVVTRAADHPAAGVGKEMLTCGVVCCGTWVILM